MALQTLGAFINSTLYLLMVFTAALVDNNHVAVVLIIAATMTTFFSYCAQHTDLIALTIVIHLLSWVLCAAAFIALVVGYFL